MPDIKVASLKETMNYFGMTPSKFNAEWRKMTVDDKAQIRAGIGDGSLTY